MAYYTMKGTQLTRSIIKTGAAKLRVMKNTPSISQGKIKATAALTLIGASTMASATVGVARNLVQDNIDAANYKKRQLNKKKKK